LQIARRPRIVFFGVKLRRHAKNIFGTNILQETHFVIREESALSPDVPSSKNQQARIASVHAALTQMRKLG
jgi:hypothetical protein